MNYSFVESKVINGYTRGEQIAKGGQARVYKCTKEEGQFVMKVMEFKTNESLQKFQQREQQIIEKLKDNTLQLINLVNHYDVIIDEVQLQAIIIMEECDMDLTKLIKSNSQYPPYSIFKQIVDGYCQLQILFDHQFMHRDLKPENILIKQGIIKICDFGLSKVVGESRDHTNGLGSFRYMPLEQLTRNDYDHRVDIWALGAILYELTYKEYLIKGNTIQQCIGNLKNLSTYPPPYYQCDPQLVKLMKGMLNPDPTMRWTLYELRGYMSQILSVSNDVICISLEHYKSKIKPKVDWSTLQQQFTQCKLIKNRSEKIAMLRYLQIKCNDQAKQQDNKEFRRQVSSELQESIGQSTEGIEFSTLSELNELSRIKKWQGLLNCFMSDNDSTMI